MRLAPVPLTAKETSRLGSSIRSAVLIAAFVFASTLSSASAAHAEEQSWVGTWMASPQPTWKPDFALPTKIPQSVKDQTIRQVVRISLGGDRVRLVFSNTYGDQPLKIGAAGVGLAGENGAVEPATIRKVTFGGKDEILVPPGAPAVSDPLDLTVGPQAKLAVSLYLPEDTADDVPLGRPPDGMVRQRGSHPCQRFRRYVDDGCPHVSQRGPCGDPERRHCRRRR